MWRADSSSDTFQPVAGPSRSPHPLRLAEVIATGHEANIFSAKFLPHANTPTIVSCAGDSVVRVFEVERLSRAPLGGIAVRGRDELSGDGGPG